MASNEMLEQMRAEAEQHEGAAQALRQAIAVLEGNAFLVTAAGNPVPKSHEFRGLAITDAAKRFLDEVGGRASTRDISEALLNRGIETRSKNFPATVYSTLDNAKGKFVRNKHNEWEAK